MVTEWFIGEHGLTLAVVDKIPLLKDKTKPPSPASNTGDCALYQPEKVE